MSKPMTEQDTAALEQLVDSFELGHVLTALELICHEKAAHLRANWQDNRQARAWEQAAKPIYKAAETALALDL